MFTVFTPTQCSESIEKLAKLSLEWLCLIHPNIIGVQNGEYSTLDYGTLFYASN